MAGIEPGSSVRILFSPGVALRLMPPREVGRDGHDTLEKGGGVLDMCDNTEVL